MGLNQSILEQAPHKPDNQLRQSSSTAISNNHLQQPSATTIFNIFSMNPTLKYLVMLAQDGDEFALHKMQLALILSYLSPCSITEEYFKGYRSCLTKDWTNLFYIDGRWNHLKFVRCFQQLEKASLGCWEITPNGACFKLHPRNCERYESVFSAEEKQEAMIEVIRVLAHCLRSPAKQFWSSQERSQFLKHINACLDVEARLFDGKDEGITQEPEALRCFASFYQEMGLYESSHALYAFMLARYEGPSPENPQVQSLLESYGVLLDLQGKHGAAEIILRELLEAKYALLGKNHVQCFRTMENLANSVRNQGRYAEAEQLYDQLEWQCEEPWLSLRNNHALLHWRRGKLPEAEEIMLDVLMQQHHTKGEKHPETLDARHNLGSLYLDTCEYDKARYHLFKAFSGRRKLLGWPHPSTLMSARNFAAAEIEFERFNEAEHVLQKALQHANMISARDDDIVLDIMDTVALLSASRGDLEEARALLRENLDLSIARRGADNPKTILIMQALAILWDIEGDQEVAAEIRSTMQISQACSCTNLPLEAADSRGPVYEMVAETLSTQL